MSARILIITARWGCRDTTAHRITVGEPIADAAVATARIVERVAAVVPRHTGVQRAIDAVLAIRVALTGLRALGRHHPRVFIEALVNGPCAAWQQHNLATRPVARGCSDAKQSEPVARSKSRSRLHAVIIVIWRRFAMWRRLPFFSSAAGKKLRVDFRTGLVFGCQADPERRLVLARRLPAPRGPATPAIHLEARGADDDLRPSLT